MSSKAKQVVDAVKPVVVKRDINKWLYHIRQFLMLRKFTHNQRHEFEMVNRTQPQPLLPGGFAHKLFKNYYCDRDARRQVGSPQVLFSTNAVNQVLASGATQQQITAGATAQSTAPAATTTSTSTSEFVSIVEAEKLTASLLASGSSQKGKPRTPGKIYNWDG